MPNAHRYANKSQTTLNNGGSINNSSDPVTFTLTSVSTFPTDGDFQILIDNEIMTVTSVSGSTFTASRAQEGSTIATHADGTTVYGIISKASLDGLSQDCNDYGTYANRPDIARKGQSYRCTDVPFNLISNGSTWEVFYGNLKVDLSGLTTLASWANQGSSTWTDWGPSKRLTVVPASGEQCRVRYGSVADADFTWTLGFESNSSYNNANENCGIMIRLASGGKISAFANSYNSKAYIFNWNSPTSYNGSPYFINCPHYPATWYRIRRTSNVLYYERSVNGIDWMTHYSVSVGSSFFGVAPDGVGLYINTVDAAGANPFLNVIHAKLET